MVQQINPPFDGSAPCPGCQHEVRSLAASIHNILTRCDIQEHRVRESKAMVKLFDLRYAEIPEILTVPDPASEEIVAVGRELKAIASDMTQEGQTIRWTPDITKRFEALIMRAGLASDAYDDISRAHFHDARHSHSMNDENILKSSQGSSWPGFVHKKSREGTSYNYTVEVVSEDGDLTHDVCGTHLKIHEHFKANLKADPTFYGKVWCPTCKLNASWRQFTYRP